MFSAHLIAEAIVSAILKEIEEQALRLTPKERGELAHRLIVSLDGEPEDSPETIAKAWDEEIARRVADMEAGRTHWILADEVMTKFHAKIAAAVCVWRSHVDSRSTSRDQSRMMSGEG